MKNNSALFLFALIFGAILLSQVALAEDMSPRLKYELLLSDSTNVIGLKDVPLYPDFATAGMETIQNTSEAKMHGELIGINGLSLNWQLRGLIRDSGAEEGVYPKGEFESLDEFYLNLPIEQSNIYIGRKNMVYGQSYAINPADVFYDDFYRDRRKGFARQRSEQPGLNLVGFTYIGNAISLDAFYAPKIANSSQEDTDQWAASFRKLSADSAVDYRFMAYNNSNFGLATTITASLGQAAIVYLDANVEKRQSMQSILKDEGEKKEFFPSATMGIGYTTKNNISMNLEYSHLSANFSKGEWNDLISNIDEISPPKSLVSATQLKAYQQALNYSNLRQNYFFARAAQDDILNKFSSEISILLGLDDSSGIASSSISYPFGEYGEVKIYASLNFGGDDSEYKLRNANSEVGVAVTMSIRDVIDLTN